MKLIRITCKDAKGDLEGFSIKSNGIMWKPRGAGYYVQNKDYPFAINKTGEMYFENGKTMLWNMTSIAMYIKKINVKEYIDKTKNRLANPDPNNIFEQKYKKENEEKLKYAEEIYKIWDTYQKSADKLIDFIRNKSYIEI